MEIPYALRRFSYLRHGLRVDRDDPDFDGLASIEDPEEFCWRILPHAARSFAVSITLLPERIARTAAVGYLYARMLDSYEDLPIDRLAGRAALEEFGRRFGQDPPAPAPDLAAPTARDRKDLVSLVLIRRCGLVDECYRLLDEHSRSETGLLVRRMARGMVWASEVFETQGGVLESEEQLRRYCHVVIGEPALFVLRLTAGRPLRPEEEAAALEVSELIQLANVTRDIERDLARGVAYHPSLRRYLTDGRGAAEAIRKARIELCSMALDRASSYRLLASSIRLPPFSPARAAAVAMLSFTADHYRRQAILVGAAEPRSDDRTRPLMRSLPAAASARWATRSLARLERHLAETGRALRT